MAQAVNVDGDDVTPQAMTGATDIIGKGSAHEAAYILDLATPGFVSGGILLGCLVGLPGGGEAGTETVPSIAQRRP